MESNFELIFEPQFTKDYRKLINTTKRGWEKTNDFQFLKK